MKKSLLTLLMMAFVLPTMAQFSKPRRVYVEHLVKTDNPDRRYNIGEPASVVVEAYMGGNPVDGITVYYKAGDEMFLPAATDSVCFKNGMAVIPLGTRMQPGFKACELSFTIDGKKYKDMIKVAFEPELLRPLTPVPADFGQFWQKTMKSTNKIDLNPQLTHLSKYSTETVDVYLVTLTVGADGRNMNGYLTKPKDGKKHPVLFCPPGAGANKITPTTFYSDRGYIYMNINIHSGCNPELDDATYAEARKVADDYNRKGIESRESYYYREVYAGCSRCVDFLMTLPDWDGRNVGVTGGSQGGALSIITAALNPHVTFCVPFYPALCDVLGFKHGRAGGWPKFFQKKSEKDGAEETLAYYDVANFARILKCPVFYSFGFNDNTCSPTSTYATYNVIPTSKTLDITPSSGHWRFTDSNDKAMEWMQKQLK